jgi:hypothetical protein
MKCLFVTGKNAAEIFITGILQHAPVFFNTSLQ